MDIRLVSSDEARNRYAFMLHVYHLVSVPEIQVELRDEHYLSTGT
jgi:hypothetical protein